MQLVEVLMKKRTENVFFHELAEVICKHVKT